MKPKRVAAAVQIRMAGRRLPRIYCLVLAIGLLIVCVGRPARAQDAVAAEQHRAAADVQSFSFTLSEANTIQVPAVINGQDKLTLMLHTAINAVSVTSAAARQVATLKFDKVENVKSWGGEQTARLSEGNTLQIGDLSWPDLQIGESENSGPGTDGKFGLNLFAGKVIEIDFDHSVVKLHDSLPELDDQYQRLTMTLEHGSMFVEGTLVVGDARLTHKFLVHSGYGGTLLLDDQFVAEHQLVGQFTVLEESELKDSFGNVLKTKKVRLPELNLAGATFQDLPIGFFAGSLGRQKLSVLGCDLLKRFNLVIDAAHQHIYLKPNSHAKAAFAK